MHGGVLLGMSIGTSRSLSIALPSTYMSVRHASDNRDLLTSFGECELDSSPAPRFERYVAERHSAGELQGRLRRRGDVWIGVQDAMYVVRRLE